MALDVQRRKLKALLLILILLLLHHHHLPRDTPNDHSSLRTQSRRTSTKLVTRISLVSIGEQRIFLEESRDFLNKLFMRFVLLVFFTQQIAGTIKQARLNDRWSSKQNETPIEFMSIREVIFDGGNPQRVSLPRSGSSVTRRIRHWQNVGFIRRVKITESTVSSRSDVTGQSRSGRQGRGWLENPMDSESIIESREMSQDKQIQICSWWFFLGGYQRDRGWRRVMNDLSWRQIYFQHRHPQDIAAVNGSSSSTCKKHHIAYSSKNSEEDFRRCQNARSWMRYQVASNIDQQTRHAENEDCKKWTIRVKGIKSILFFVHQNIQVSSDDRSFSRPAMRLMKSARTDEFNSAAYDRFNFWHRMSCTTSDRSFDLCNESNRLVEAFC